LQYLKFSKDYNNKLQLKTCSSFNNGLTKLSMYLIADTFRREYLRHCKILHHFYPVIFKRLYGVPELFFYQAPYRFHADK